MFLFYVMPLINEKKIEKINLWENHQLHCAVKSFFRIVRACLPLSRHSRTIPRIRKLGLIALHVPQNWQNLWEPLSKLHSNSPFSPNMSSQPTFSLQIKSPSLNPASPSTTTSTTTPSTAPLTKSPDPQPPQLSGSNDRSNPPAASPSRGQCFHLPFRT